MNLSRRLFGQLSIAIGLVVLSACGSPEPTPTPTAMENGSPAQATNTPVPETPYFEGKQITVVTPGSPGGGYDLFSRLVATHMANHIPGEPQILVENKPGGSTHIAPNWLYTAAPTDGTYIGNYVGNRYQNQFMGDDTIDFDVTKFIHMGSPTYNPTVAYCRSDVVGERTPQEIAAAQAEGTVKAPLINGRQSPVDHYAAFLTLTTGVDIRTVAGYAASAEVNRGFRAGESDCAGSTLDSALIQLEDMFEAGEMTFLVQDGSPEGARAPEVPDTPTIDELAAGNSEHQAIADFLKLSAFAGRPFVIPPGVPDDVVQILRDGFADTMEDPAFIAAAEQQGYTIVFVEPEEIERLHRTVFEISGTERERLVEFLEPGG